MLEALRRAATDLDYGGVRDVLCYAVKEYRPTSGIDDLPRQEHDARADDEHEIASFRSGRPLPPWVDPPTL